MKEAKTFQAVCLETAVPCTFAQLQGFGTDIGPLKKYHFLNDLLNASEVLLQSANGLNNVELLYSIKAYLAQLHHVCEHLEALEGQATTLLSVEDPSIVEKARSFKDASRALRSKFIYLLTSLIEASKDLAVNARNQTQIQQMNNLLLETNLCLVKMSFLRSTALFFLNPVDVQPAVTVQLPSTSATSHEGQDAQRETTCIDNLTAGALDAQFKEIDCGVAELPRALSEQQQAQMDPSLTKEAILDAKRQLHRYLQLLVGHIQKLLVALKLSDAKLAPELWTLMGTISDAVEGLSPLGSQYLSLANDSALQSAGLLLFGTFLKQGQALKKYGDLSLNKDNGKKGCQGSSSKSMIASLTYDLAKTTKEILKLLE